MIFNEATLNPALMEMFEHQGYNTLLYNICY